MSRTNKIIHAARPRAEGEPSYHQVHRAGRRLLKPVECVHCGATRTRLHLALRHDADPAFFRVETNRTNHGRLYSLQGPSAYQVLCTQHHGLYDARERRSHRFADTLSALSRRVAA